MVAMKPGRLNGPKDTLVAKALSYSEALSWLKNNRGVR